MTSGLNAAKKAYVDGWAIERSSHEAAWPQALMVQEEFRMSNIECRILDSLFDIHHSIEHGSAAALRDLTLTPADRNLPSRTRR